MRLRLTTPTAVLLAVLGNAALSAESGPARSIRFIVPHPPGGPTDLMARSMAGRLSEALGQTGVVDNRAGAGATSGSVSTR